MLSRFGRQQLKIMLILWEKGQATAREIAEELCRERRVAYSTVQTILRRLEEKGAVTHDVEGRTFIFRPLLELENVRADGVHEVLGRIFDDSPGELIAHLLQHEQYTPEEREAFRAAIKELTKKSRKKRRTENT